jgi:hypothetical protein
MKYFFAVLLFLVLPLSFFAISGCESTTGPDGTGTIKGTIRDSTSSIEVSGVTITTVPATSTVVTNDSGNFIITGVSNGTYTITAKKLGYFTRTTTAVISNADTAIVNTRMQFTGIYAYNNLTVSEYIDNSSLSGVNLRNGLVIDEVQLNDPNKDIQMRDSAGTSSNFYLRSGDLALQYAGSRTDFGAPLNNPISGQPAFTKTEFDTLSKIYDFDGSSFNTYFGTDRTSYFNVFAEGANNVYPFWLSGRGSSPQIFGVIYLRNSYVSSNVYHLVIDIKLNSLGYNLFNPNQ